MFCARIHAFMCLGCMFLFVQQGTSKGRALAVPVCCSGMFGGCPEAHQP